FGLYTIAARSVAPRLEARQTPRLRLVAIDRECFIVPASGMGNMVDAATDRSLRPCIIDVEGQRRMDWQDGMEAGGRMPRLVADASHGNARCRRRRERHGAAVAGDGIARRVVRRQLD